MVILGPIDFLFGLPLNINVNDWQNKFEVDILKNVAKIANFRLKIGQLFFRDESNDDTLKLLTCKFWFWTPFLLRGFT